MVDIILYIIKMSRKIKTRKIIVQKGAVHNKKCFLLIFLLIGILQLRKSRLQDDWTLCRVVLSETKDIKEEK